MNRRKFLLSTTAAAACLAVTPFPLQAKVNKKKRLKNGKSNKLTLSFEPYELKLRHSFNLASSQRTTTPGVQLRIDFDGITGYGEASMPPYLGESVATVCSFLSQLNLAQFSDPFAFDTIISYMDSVAPGNNAAKAAVDIALHDLTGKLMGQPWHKIWGLDPEQTPCTSFTVSYDENPTEMDKKIEEAAPFKIIKVKLGLGRDRETIERIRQRLDTPLCVDVNQGWHNRDEALDMCHWLNENGCTFVEQPFPVENIDDTAWLRERSPLPIIADEAVKRLYDVKNAAQAYDGINIKLMKSGGMHEAYQMAVAARALGLKVMLGCMAETSCAVTAAAQLSPLAHWADLDGNLLISNDLFNGMTVVDGKIALPSTPGIGVSLI